jgi:hypothetical protein
MRKNGHPDRLRAHRHRPALLRYTINGPALLSHLMEAGTNGDDRNAVGHPGTADPITIERPFTLRRRGVEARIVLEDGDAGSRTPDQALVNLIVRAHRLRGGPGGTRTPNQAVMSRRL